MATDHLTRLVKPHGRGQITIPADFRQRLGIDEETLLQMTLKGARIEITPLRVVDGSQLLRKYDAREIETFLEEDKIDPRVARKARKLLGS
ncbi:MAG TPA: AbrB/MazE/SpoVT family DNA-binding domain-containing protein [Anaerolineae bacterium]